jgi:hypothetical protein
MAASFCLRAEFPGSAERYRVSQSNRRARRLKATPAAFIGLADAPDEAGAIKIAIKQFGIPAAGSKVPDRCAAPITWS